MGHPASGAKALTERNSFIAALKALRHPKSTYGDLYTNDSG